MAYVVVTYVAADQEPVDRLERWLALRGHRVLPLRGLRLGGQDLKDRAVTQISDADAVLAVVSRHSWASAGFAFELGLVRSLQATLDRGFLLGLRLDDAPVPSVLGGSRVIDGVQGLVDGLEALNAALREPRPPEPAVVAFGQAQAMIAGPAAAPAWAQAAGQLLRSARAGEVALFLGAGVSVSAGIPAWERLVDRVLGRALGRIAGPGPDLPQLAGRIRATSRASDLVLAQHARRELGPEFNRVLRDELYRGSCRTGPLVQALGELAQRHRTRAAVTYNFDDLFETELGRRGVAHHVVTQEGDPGADGLPVFHVHGVARRGRVRHSGLVFAESEFHAESLDPYRWSSLVQLSALSRSTCLFVGHSLSDPSLRRLLDVVKTRSAEPSRAHYAILRRTSPAEVVDPSRTPVAPADAARAAQVIDLLREGDLNGLGLQVIWVDGYDQMPTVVRDLATA